MKSAAPARLIPRIAHQRDGLSLLEVIVSTVILAVSSLMLVQILRTAERNAARADERLMGQLICENKLNEIQTGLLPIEAVDRQPTVYYPDWQYAITVRDWNSEALTANGELVVVEVLAYYAPVTAATIGSREISDPDQRPAFSLQRLLRRSPTASVDSGVSTWEGRQ